MLGKIILIFTGLYQRSAQAVTNLFSAMGFMVRRSKRKAPGWRYDLVIGTRMEQSWRRTGSTKHDEIIVLRIFNLYGDDYTLGWCQRADIRNTVFYRERKAYL